MEEPVEIDAFDIDHIRQKCRDAVARHADAQWFFNLTCASKIMGFGALEVAKECHASSWYLDTITRRVVTLSGQSPESDLFKLDVAEYLAGYGRGCKAADAPDERLVTFAKQLARYPAEAMKFRDSLRNSHFSQVRRGQTKSAKLTSQAGFIPAICRQAQAAGLVKDFRQTSVSHEITVEGNGLYSFLDGKWLEVFVYSAACGAGCFDDKRLDVEIPGITGANNNLDLAVTHAASLIIAECKTEKELEPEHLNKLSAIANLVGGNYVGRMFVTSKVVNQHDKSQVQSFNDFCGQAQARRVVVVTGDKLKSLAQIFQQEVKKPTYPRE